MTINLISSDYEAMAKKIASVFKSNNETRPFVDVKVERYGIPFKVSVCKNWDDNNYTIEDVCLYGINTNNVTVLNDDWGMRHFGNIAV